MPDWALWVRDEKSCFQCQVRHVDMCLCCSAGGFMFFFGWVASIRVKGLSS